MVSSLLVTEQHISRHWCRHGLSILGGVVLLISFWDTDAWIMHLSAVEPSCDVLQLTNSHMVFHTVLDVPQLCLHVNIPVASLPLQWSALLSVWFTVGNRLSAEASYSLILIEFPLDWTKQLSLKPIEKWLITFSKHSKTGCVGRYSADCQQRNCTGLSRN